MPTIRIEDDVFQGLQRLAEPFVDSPSAVIRRLLEEKGVLAPGQPRKRAAPNRSGTALTSQAIYEQYLLHVLDREFKGSAHKRAATAAVVKRMLADGFIGAAEQEMVATGETRAENTLTWGRNALKDRGYLSKTSGRGIWELTAEGRAAARALTLPKSKPA